MRCGFANFLLSIGDMVISPHWMVGCGGAEYAREEGIPVLLFPKTSTLNEGLSAVDLVSSLR